MSNWNTQKKETDVDILEKCRGQLGTFRDNL